MNSSNPTSRLTENEKVCLRRKMYPETSKEIARALDISVHAVDKRLKTARLKLGVSTTLEAARLLAKAESEGQLLVPSQTDLSPSRLEYNVLPDRERKTTLFLAPVVGGIIMIVAVAFLISQASVAPEYRAATSSSEAETFLSASFDIMDRDRSGYVEEGEQPPFKVRRIESDGKPAETQLRNPEEWIELFDTDGDRRVSRAEYISHLLPVIIERGVPSNWKAPKS